MNNQLSIRDINECNKEIEEFKKDGVKLGEFTSNFIQDFYPSYELNNELVGRVEKENSMDVLNGFTFYRICECTIDKVEDSFAYFSEKLKKLFVTAYSIKREVCYGIVSLDGLTALVIGINQDDKDDTMKCIIEGLLPGIKLVKYTNGFKNSTYSDGKYKDWDKDRYVGCISGVPALKIDGVYQKKDISALMRSLNGQNYTIMVLCKPLDEYEIQEKINQAISIQDGCFAISKRTLSFQQGESDGQTHTDTQNTTDTTGKTKTHGGSIGGALPLAAAGAAVGSVIPGVGTVVGAVGGGLIGLIVGKQMNLNRSTAKTTNRSVSEGYSDAVTRSINSSESISAEVQNGYAIELMNMAENMIERLKLGRSIGMWRSLVTYSSDSEMASEIIQGSLYSEIASGIPEVLPPVVFKYKDSCKDMREKNIHNQQIIIPKGFFTENSDNALCSLVTSEELCGICTIPTDNTVGFQIREEKGYALNCEQINGGAKLGYVCEYDRPLPNVSFSLSEEDLNKHTFVCGITGCGKTNTVKNILGQIDKPFLVIEPAKKEYRNLNKENLKIFTLGRPEINCIRINPFYIFPGVSPQQHIDLLKDLFSASFALYGPMPYIVEKCLYNVYINKGWNLTLGFHPLLVDSKGRTSIFENDKVKEQYAKKAHRFVFPTMQDLKEEVDRYIESETTYEGEIKGNIRGAIKARIDSLCVGAKGYMFNTDVTIDFDDIFNSNCVLELEGLADDADKAFALGLLIIFVNEYRQIQYDLDSSKRLKHLLVIEEAHRLLKNVSSESNEDLGNPKGKAVEHFTNMLAEMRSYGQGVIVAEQIPSKLAPEVIKNSSNKIIHRIVAKDDQELISSTIGVSPEDSIYLGNQKVGFALCHKEGMAKPVVVKVDKSSSNNIMDVQLLNNNYQNKIFDINCSILNNEMLVDIDLYAIRTLISLMYRENVQSIYDGLENAVEKIKENTVHKCITLIPGVDKKECILWLITHRVQLFLMTGVFSNHVMIEDSFFDDIIQMINAPSEQIQNKVYIDFEQFYRQSPKSKAVETVAGLVLDKFVNGQDIMAIANDYSLCKETSFGMDVQCYLEKGVI